MKRSALGHIFLIALLATACTEQENIIPKPSISISSETLSNWNGCIKGEAKGIDPKLYHMVLYAKTNNLWYLIPDKDSSVIPISNENYWICQFETLPADSISELIIFLLPNTFNPPMIDGEKNLPVKLNLLAAARYKLVLIDPSL